MYIIIASKVGVPSLADVSQRGPSPLLEELGVAMLQDCESPNGSTQNRVGGPPDSSIRLMWDGGLSDAVKERFDAIKKHLTPPTLNGEDNTIRGMK